MDDKRRECTERGRETRERLLRGGVEVELAALVLDRDGDLHPADAHARIGAPVAIHGRGTLPAINHSLTLTVC